MKVKINALRQMIQKELKLLREASEDDDNDLDLDAIANGEDSDENSNEDDSKNSEKDDLVKEDGQDSIDDQIDDFLTQYESDSTPSKNEALKRLQSVRRLIEAPEDEKEVKKENELDVDAYANNVSRLIENFDSLIETRNTILRRAINFLVENHDSTIVDEFKEKMKTEHGLEVGKTKADTNLEYQSPLAIGSLGDDGGGGGAV